MYAVQNVLLLSCFAVASLGGCPGSAEEGGDAAGIPRDAQGSIADASTARDDAGLLPDADNCPTPYLVFLNTAGATITDGVESSISDQFPFFFGSSTALPAWPGTSLDVVLPCLQTIFADFHIEFTDDDPGDVAHLEVVMTSSSLDFALLQESLLGLEAFTLSGALCGANANPMSFVFDDSWRDDEHLCRGMAQAVGFGIVLGPSGSCVDIASSIECAGPATITNVPAECGPQGGMDCRCSDGTTQNSYERLADFVGLACP